MKKTLLFYLSFITVFVITEGCHSSSGIYKNDNKNRIYTGQLSDSTFFSLKKVLSTSANSTLKDTIIIKYDYNNETCWKILDQSADSHIMGFVTRHQDRVKGTLAARQDISVFEFREPGNNLNKIKKWNNSILIDSTRQVFNMLFRERSTCGSSIIIMPDRKFVFIRSDSHSDVLDLTKTQIEALLNKK